MVVVERRMLRHLVSHATRRLLLRAPKERTADEESRVDFRLALSGVVSLSAGRYVVETICGDSDRMNPNKHLAS